MKLILASLTAATLLAATGFQSAPPGTPPSANPALNFDVVSIHLAKPSESGFIKALPGGQEYTSQNIPIKLIISLMYRVPLRQISGGPDWITSQTYDIEAKADHGSYSIDDLHIMFQNLLADRFQLRFHKEVREGNVYSLAVDKSGSKLKLNTSPQNFDIPINFTGPGSMSGVRVPIPYFCWVLGQVLDNDARPVIDRTGLDKFYDFTLSFLPPLPPDVPKDSLPPGLLDRPSIFNALREQLGLTLTPQKGPVEYYIIDHIERPSEN